MHCNKEDCIVCTSGGKGNCRAMNVVYNIVCDDCNEVYIGETAIYTYSREHMKDLEKKYVYKSVYTIFITFLSHPCLNGKCLRNISLSADKTRYFVEFFTVITIFLSLCTLAY